MLRELFNVYDYLRTEYATVSLTKCVMYNIDGFTKSNIDTFIKWMHLIDSYVFVYIFICM